jgi:hypothetical protein
MPDRFRLLPVEALEHRCDHEDVTRPESDLLTPVQVEQRLAVEFYDLAYQTAERTLRRRLDRREDRAEEFRQTVCPQREPGHDAKAPAAATLDRPEQVRIHTGVSNPYRAIGNHDLGFQQARRSHPIGLREASETATLDQTRNANGHASATLDVAPPSRRHSVIDLTPDGTRFHRNRRLRQLLSCAPGTDERIMQSDGVHFSSPEQQRICGVRCALVTVAAALHNQS